MTPTRAEPRSETPFGMPLAVFAVSARLHRALGLNDHAGASLATTLRGAYDAALLRAGCAPAPGPRRCDRAAEHEQRAVVCRSPATCPTPALYKPRSQAQRRDTGGCELDVTLALWGRRAATARTLSLGALEGAGRAGLWDGASAVPFDVASRVVFEGTLEGWATRGLDAAAAAGRVLIELATPLQSRDGAFAHVLGVVAHDLVQWDLEDDGSSAELGKRGCDELADAVRLRAEAALDGVAVDVRALDAEDQGLRRSRSNRGAFRLYGVSGFVELTGDLTRAWPWLRALALRGAGQKRSFGLGEVRLWLPAPG